MNKKGFALNEVLLALMVISFSLTALIILSGNLLRSSMRSFHLFELENALTSALVQAHQEEWGLDKKKRIQTYNNDQIKVTYETKTIPAGSKLSRFKDHLMMEMVSAEKSGFSFQPHLIAFVFKEKKS